MKSTPSWLEKAVFYQIYPQTFYDANGDGIWDIPGIVQKLGYLRSLGVNALWLNPCFESPFFDAGYDVSDYYKVAPRYGTNDDLQRLFVEAKRHYLRIFLDLVPGHTSIENAWFKESCRHEPNEYSDWFIWTNSVWMPPLPGLQNVRGFAERNGGFIVNFFYHQPALNFGFANPDSSHPWQQAVDAPGPQRVRQEIKNIMKFWLEMGADGFRVDMAGSLVKFDFSGKETARFWQWIRQWLDAEYPEAAIVAEWSRPLVSIPGAFHMDFMLPFGARGYSSLFRKPYGRGPGADPYSWSFFDRSGNGNIREFLDEYLPNHSGSKDEGFISLISGNHDVYPRLSKGRNTDDLELAFLFLLTMPGVPFIYYGDEIGMRDVEGLPSKEGGYERTMVRSPMQWDDSPNAGFSTATAEQLYLPIDPAPDRPTVAAQLADPTSLLNRTRRLIALRQSHPALCASGDFEVIFAEGGKVPFVYRRSTSDENLLVAINPADRPGEVVLPAALISNPPTTLFGAKDAFRREGNKWTLRLPGVAGGVYRL